MKKNIFKNFILCGLIGWCMECFWTGLGSLFGGKDPTLTCHTSIWMFPIYGMAALVAPVSKLLKNRNAIVRGGVYTIFIFIAEYVTGCILKRYNACPWDYSTAKLNYKGVIRLDFAPVWFFVGLLFEKLLYRTKNSTK